MVGQRPSRLKVDKVARDAEGGEDVSGVWVREGALKMWPIGYLSAKLSWCPWGVHLATDLDTLSNDYRCFPLVPVGMWEMNNMNMIMNIPI